MFWPLLEYESRKDDMKMVFIRIASAILCIFIVIQLAKEPENIDNLTDFTSSNMNDLFEWGNERFVHGKIADSNGNGTRRAKSSRDIFMSAIFDDEELVVPEED